MASSVAHVSSISTSIRGGARRVVSEESAFGRDLVTKRPIAHSRLRLRANCLQLHAAGLSERSQRIGLRRLRELAGHTSIAVTTAIPSTGVIASAAPVREIDFSGQPSFNNGSEAGQRPRTAGDVGFSGKRAVVCSIRNVDTSRRETGCVLPQPVFATMEEVLHAHELLLQLRVRLMCDAA